MGPSPGPWALGRCRDLDMYAYYELIVFLYVGMNILWIVDLFKTLKCRQKLPIVCNVCVCVCNFLSMLVPLRATAALRVSRKANAKLAFTRKATAKMFWFTAFIQ